jgi:hypothetical protein
MLFVNHSKCRDMKSKKADNNKKNNILKRNNKTATTSRRRSKTNSDRIVKKRQRLAIKKTKPLKRKQPQQQISIKRSSGRKEKFDTDRMAQTVSRSGVPFLMARDIAKKVSNKIMSDTDTRLRHIKGRNSNKSRSIRLKEKTVTGSKIRNLVSNELRNRNRGDIAASYSGQTPENTLLEKNLRSKYWSTCGRFYCV